MKPYLPIIRVLLLLFSAVELVLGRIAPPTRSDLEADSTRVGWSFAVESDHLARDIHLRVDDERRARGLAAAVWDDGLAELARQRSETMIAGTYEYSPEEFRHRKSRAVTPTRGPRVLVRPSGSWSTDSSDSPATG